MLRVILKREKVRPKESKYIIFFIYSIEDSQVLAE